LLGGKASKGFSSPQRLHFFVSGGNAPKGITVFVIERLPFNDDVGKIGEDEDRDRREHEAYKRKDNVTEHDSLLQQ